MGCTLSKVSNNIEKETSIGQKSHQNGLRHWVGKKRQAFIRLVRPSHFPPPQSEDCEEPPKDNFQKPRLPRRERKVTPETLHQNGPEKRATRRHRVKEVLSSSQEDIPQDDHSHHKTGKTLLRKQTPYYQPFNAKQQEEVHSSDVSQLYEAEAEPDDNTPSICQLDITPEGCEWCENTRRAERQAVLRRKAKYKRKQRGEIAAREAGWDSDEEQRAYLAGKEWQEKRKRIDKWVEDGIQEMKERLKEEERHREDIKRAASAKMEKYFAERLEKRMEAVSERVKAEAESKGENVLKRCTQMRMEEARQKEVEMEAKKREDMQTSEETERKSKETKDPFNRASFDFQDSVDELTRRKVKKTGGLDSRQKQPEKVKGKRGHAHPMEELDVAINELLAKDDAKSHARSTSLKSKQVAVPRNTPTMHGVPPSVASRYQGGVHFQATCSSSHNGADRGCPPIAKLNQMTSQRRRLPRPNAAYGDRPYPPTTGRIPESAWEFFQRQRKH